MLKKRPVAACRSSSLLRQTRLGGATVSKKLAAGGAPCSGSKRYQVMKEALNAAKGVVKENLAGHVKLRAMNRRKS